MDEIKGILSILAFTILQGSYDYLGWGLIILAWLKVSEDSWQAKTYRVIKELLDFGLTPYIMIFWLHLWWYDIAWFFILKAAHSCDRWYNGIDKWRGIKPSFWGHWRWWVMWYGWRRTDWTGKGADQLGYTYKDYIRRSGYFKDYNDDGYNDIVSKMEWMGIYNGDYSFKYRRGMVNLDEVDRLNNIVWSCCIAFYLIKFIINHIIL